MRRKFKTKGIISLIVAVLVIAAISSLAVFTDGFTEWDIRDVNPDNLIKVDDYSSTLDAKRTDGLKVDFDEDGVITVDGKNSGATDIKIEVATITLAKGQYTFSTSARGADDKTYYMSLETTDLKIMADDGEDSTFIVDTETEFVIYIVVCAGEEIDTTFKPVLVTGDDEGSFYIIG